MLCFSCPRECGVDRSKQRGFCGECEKIRVSKVIENFMWEEPCISGEKGALAIFFSGCNLRCSFCQNYKISHVGKGDLFSPQEFRKFLESFDLTKFSSIDLITPTHFSEQLLQAFADFSSPIPVVWNSSAYEKVETIEKVSAFVDVFLPDFKYADNELSQKLSGAKNYFEITLNAIKKMSEIKGENIFKNEILTSGVLIRHLVLPAFIKNSFSVLDAIKENISSPFISIMSQFTPNGLDDMKNKLKVLEYKSVLAHAEKLGLNQGYFQDFESADQNFVPSF